MRAGRAFPDGAGVCVPVPSLKVYHSPIRPSSSQIVPVSASMVSMTPWPQPSGAAGAGPEQANAKIAHDHQKMLPLPARELIPNCDACHVTRHGHRVGLVRTFGRSSSFADHIFMKVVRPTLVTRDRLSR